jgi:hypothetical protein
MKIVVAGGGTAGWLTALMLTKCYPQHKVTVIESKQIGIIGTGESSTGALADIINNPIFGIDKKHFVEQCDGTAKYGIKHIGWNVDPTKHYYGPIGGSDTCDQDQDLIFNHSIANLPLDKIHLGCEHGVNIDQNTCSVYDDPALNVWHFDTHKLGAYLSTIIDAEIIDDIVTDVELDNGNVKQLHCKSGRIVDGDFFIDATGFKKVIMNKLNAQWKSYKNNLPVNSAIPFILPYDDNEVIEPVTVAFAQKYGWCWMIPTNERYGCGYVFDDTHISADQAHDEIEKSLGKKIEPIKTIKFESGRQQKLWIKNCMAIGLAAAFAEPLEATSIHTTVFQLNRFIKDFENMDSESFNNYCATMYDNMKEFLLAHYMCGRNDSDFWRKITAGETISDFVKDILEVSKHRVPSKSMFPKFYGSAGWPLWCWVLAGTGNITPEIARKELKYYEAEDTAELLYNNSYEKHMYHASTLPKNNAFIRGLGKTI